MLLWLLTEDGLSVQDLDRGLQRESGLYGLSDGYSDDTRQLVAVAREGHHAAETSLAVFCHRVRGVLASAATSLARLDAAVFTTTVRSAHRAYPHRSSWCSRGGSCPCA